MRHVVPLCTSVAAFAAVVVLSSPLPAIAGLERWIGGDPGIVCKDIAGVCSGPPVCKGIARLDCDVKWGPVANGWNCLADPISDCDNKNILCDGNAKACQKP
jgi:hypothetical protein